ncbi:hypothetical protein CKA32_005930 [Geitlerinema sp. FC II]|nr:hypothetical protein CKA32_005930 [Geitlerinema sp. FC II]
MFGFSDGDRDRHTSNFRREAVVSKSILPRQKGRVLYQGTYWFARCLHPITLEQKEVVEVIGIDGLNLTLIVKPFAEE